ncbi:hypothetical protein F5J12DRAFT_783687 [Pisolithus orientalis]|uniref:uncharacterized protein n=1 Tax=Pisolithus orientalis TaxID=936130 RepID=UPI002225B6AC|nr:uncharacterized protein F5J12DRAFT_783687 [Pisolithus orientalis]KAI6003261.1 hypothetical protein F5J12DRAFT_783687 [Pisolithus orientalis]
MTVEFQMDVCQVDVDMEFQDDDWGALKPQGVYHSLHHSHNVTMALAAALGCVWDLIEVVPQPEESLETIYVWVEDWDKTRASIWSWWRYINDNGISVPKVHNKCMCDYTEESVMCQNFLVLGAIAIADLWHPVEQRQIHISDIFKDYQERNSNSRRGRLCSSQVDPEGALVWRQDKYFR